jgi:hypothetical protein
MRRRRCCLYFTIASVLLSSAAVAQNSISNTPEGFQQQYHAAFDSFLAHNDAELQSHLDTFAIPAHWFHETFGAEHGPEFASQYAAEFAEFKRRATTHFGAISELKARLNIDDSVPTDVRTRRWTAAEDTMSMQRPPGLHASLPQPQKFAIDVVALSGQYGRLTSWIESFVYIDGKFRYFGEQRTPFWVKKPLSGSGRRL